MSKKILVTGGAGFIGSFLCERLLNEGNEVICLDNFYSGQKGNISHLISKPNFELIRHDVTAPIFLEVDEIYNLACPASPIHYQYNPIKTIKTSVLGAINMLGLAKRVKARILQASTSEIYGDPNIHPQSETYWGNVNPIGKRSCYDEGKRCAESLFINYNFQHSIPVKILRIFNTYGPRMKQNDGRVICSFICQAIKNDDITIFGDGTQTRSFQYINDLIEAMIRMMNTSDSFIGPVNIGNPMEIRIIDLAEMIIRLTKSKSRIIFLPLPKDDPRQRKPDIYLARNELSGWEPVVNLEDGLKATIEYFSSEIGSALNFL